MGFDYECIRKLNPRIIMCSVSTFGQSGPLAPNPGYDFIGQAYAGVTYLSGEKGGDYYSPALAVGTLAGIFRTKTGSLWIFAFQQNHWASLCEVMGQPELTNDPRCAEHSRRVANRAFVNAEICKWQMTLPRKKLLWRSCARGIFRTRPC
jgi:crotonobetainyl-CoA:carnitine CoA-transferase CaiB-like acyl-CoA transferase